MTALSAVISWTAVMALLWMAAYTFLMAVVRADGVFFAFTVAFAAAALWLATYMVREGGR